MPGAARTHRRHDSQWAAQFAAAAQLALRGYLVGLTLGNTPTADVLLESPQGAGFAVEVKGLQTLALDPGSTKNDEGRIVYMPADVKAAVTAQLARVDGLQRKLQRIVPWVFPHLRSAGEPNPGRRRVMTVTGHRTRSVFDRYHIVSPGDLQDVARRLTGTIPGTMTPQPTDARLTRVP
jgi:hypothetical protein